MKKVPVKGYTMVSLFFQQHRYSFTVASDQDPERRKIPLRISLNWLWLIEDGERDETDSKASANVASTSEQLLMTGNIAINLLSLQHSSHTNKLLRLLWLFLLHPVVGRRIRGELCLSDLNRSLQFSTVNHKISRRHGSCCYY